MDLMSGSMSFSVSVKSASSSVLMSLMVRVIVSCFFRVNVMCISLA